MDCIVCKFGGTSLASVESIKKVCEIVKGNKNIKCVVVSAPGKRFKNDTKITDLLIKAFYSSSNNKKFSEIYQEIVKRYKEIIKGLGIKISLMHDFKELKKALKEAEDYDFVLSRGEYLCAKIIAKVLAFNFIDAKDIIKFDSMGNVDITASKTASLDFLNTENYFVVPGFYGEKNQKIKLFSRGGSDITGAIMAVLLKSKLYQNYTDVDGVFDVDPNVCKKARKIDSLNYQDLKLLANCGAQVLHEDCIKFLQENNIVLNIRNTFNPSNFGTIVANKDKYNGVMLNLQKGLYFSVFKSNSISSNIESIRSILNQAKVIKIIEGLDCLCILANRELQEYKTCTKSVEIDVINILNLSYDKSVILFNVLSQLDQEILFLVKEDNSVCFGVKDGEKVLNHIYEKILTY